MFFGKFIASIIFIVLLVMVFQKSFFIVLGVLVTLYIGWRLLNHYWDRQEGKR